MSINNSRQTCTNETSKVNIRRVTKLALVGMILTISACSNTPSGNTHTIHHGCDLRCQHDLEMERRELRERRLVDEIIIRDIIEREQEPIPELYD
ncbi:hypothetical protein G3R49_09335 [Shewanella sp. WXL01]|uniref:Uncharacterized protein n=1 Tax=Shewanella maritima TaxID=2520507 RepID=A0A411PJU1_9GAMM|nr:MULTISPECIES: hypothetical protein [Shewanella]NKF50772.1 hypothetical protein [Shewanella sp. WXL01]QBF83758.1 hypothetical protein EXU30_14445 [Shewanella maritima]